ncbi:hypothetical protein IT575_07370 [bacterium]|nr:hypothetical protein [bacterium]
MPVRASATAPGQAAAEIPASIWCVYQDIHGHHWFGSNGDGALRYDGKELRRFTSAEGLPSNNIRNFQEDQAGRLYITTDAGICRFDGSGFETLVATNTPSPQDWVLQDGDMWFWLGNPYRYDGTTLYRLELPRQPVQDKLEALAPQLASNFNAVYSIYKDRQGHIWLGTGNVGLCRFDGKSLQWLRETHHTYTPEGGQIGIRAVIEDRDGDYWISNSSFRYRFEDSPAGGGSETELKFTAAPGMDLSKLGREDYPVYFQSAARDAQGDLWLQTYGDGVWHYDGVNCVRYPVKNEQGEIAVISMHLDREGVLWLGTQENGAYRFNGQSFEPFRL